MASQGAGRSKKTIDNFFVRLGVIVGRRHTRISGICYGKAVFTNVSVCEGHDVRDAVTCKFFTENVHVWKWVVSVR
jgi:hypothetical protein